MRKSEIFFVLRGEIVLEISYCLVLFSPIVCKMHCMPFQNPIVSDSYILEINVISQNS